MFYVITITMTSTSCFMAIPFKYNNYRMYENKYNHVTATINELIDILEKDQYLYTLNTIECTDLPRELCTDRS